jgi:hypothetical protein
MHVWHFPFCPLFAFIFILLSTSPFYPSVNQPFAFYRFILSFTVRVLFFWTRCTAFIYSDLKHARGWQRNDSSKRAHRRGKDISQWCFSDSEFVFSNIPQKCVKTMGILHYAIFQQHFTISNDKQGSMKHDSDWNTLVFVVSLFAG